MLTQFQQSDLHREWVLNGRPASGLVPFVAPPKMDIKEEIASVASEVHIASDVDSASDVDMASEVDVASEVDTTSDVDTTSEADTTSEVDVASESDIADEPVVQKNQKKRKLTHQKSSKEEAAHTGAIRKKRKLNKLDEFYELSPAQAFQAIKTNCIDRMVKKQQRRLRRSQKKFLRLNVSWKEAGRRAVLHDYGCNPLQVRHQACCWRGSCSELNRRSKFQHGSGHQRDRPTCSTRLWRLSLLSRHFRRCEALLRSPTTRPQA